jgi:ABC-type Fe3+/spermidine/putrescine transport system ATPase subunit
MLGVRSLTKNFAAFRAVDDVSLDINEGELVTLLGPSGCGKSTTLRCIAGLESPDSGEIRIGNELVAAPQKGIEVAPEERRIGMVFQSYALWPHMSVFENVAYPLRRQRLPAAERSRRARGALDLVGLAGYAEASPTTLSGGQQQRVALARALASECRVLLFDEPLSNLDVRLREQMRNEIRELQKRLGITSVYVTHDQSEALAISDRVVVMNEGRIVQVGAPRELYARPKTEFAASFLGTVNLLAVSSVIRDDGGCVLLRGPGSMEIRVAGVSPALSANTPLQIGIRSELMRLHPLNGACAGVNHWRGRVERAIFLGDSVEYLLGVAGTRLKARVQPYMRFEVGDELVASVAPEDCFILEIHPKS